VKDIFKTVLSALVIVSIFGGCSNNENEKISGVPAENGDLDRKELSQSTPVAKIAVSTKEFRLKSVENGEIVVTKDGNSFKTEGTRLVLFDFFTTWCPACRMVAPHLGSIQSKYPKDLTVIGVLVEEGRNDAEIIEFKKKYNANYIIANSTTAKENYANFKLSNELASLLRQPKSFPIPLLVMLKDGEYFTHYIGAVPEEMIESDIKEALNLR
jgi:thiol-disulfide isomerase/thioredoxin